MVSYINHTVKTMKFNNNNFEPRINSWKYWSAGGGDTNDEKSTLFEWL